MAVASERSDGGEDIALSSDHEGDIACRVLTVTGGARVRGMVQADEIRLQKGVLEGPVKGGRLVVLQDGEYRGEADVDVFRLAGLARGLVVAKEALAKSSARFEGYLITDSYGNEPGASMRATIVAEPGASMSTDHRAGARRELAGSGLLAEEAMAKHEAKAVPAPDREEARLSAPVRANIEAALEAAIFDQPAATAAPEVPVPPPPPAPLPRPAAKARPVPSPQNAAAEPVPAEKAPEPARPPKAASRPKPAPAGTPGRRPHLI